MLTGSDSDPAGYHTDTFYNAGTLNWDMTGGGAIDGYELVTNASSAKLQITIENGRADKFYSYSLASGDFTDVSLDGVEFTLTGGADPDVTLTVNSPDLVAYKDTAGKNWYFVLGTETNDETGEDSLTLYAAQTDTLVAVLTPEKWFNDQAAITIRGMAYDATDDYVKQVRISGYGDDVIVDVTDKKWSATLTYAAETAGTTLTVTGLDAAGNEVEDAEVEYTLKVDTVDPTLSISLSDEGSIDGAGVHWYDEGADITFSATVTDETSGVRQVRHNGELYERGQGATSVIGETLTIDTSDTTGGVKTESFTAFDVAFNAADTKSFQYGIIERQTVTLNSRVRETESLKNKNLVVSRRGSVAINALASAATDEDAVAVKYLNETKKAGEITLNGDIVVTDRAADAVSVPLEGRKTFGIEITDTKNAGTNLTTDYASRTTVMRDSKSTNAAEVYGIYSKGGVSAEGTFKTIITVTATNTAKKNGGAISATGIEADTASFGDYAATLRVSALDKAAKKTSLVDATGIKTVGSATFDTISKSIYAYASGDGATATGIDAGSIEVKNDLAGAMTVRAVSSGTTKALAEGFASIGAIAVGDVTKAVTVTSQNTDKKEAETGAATANAFDAATDLTLGDVKAAVKATASSVSDGTVFARGLYTASGDMTVKSLKSVTATATSASGQARGEAINAKGTLTVTTGTLGTLTADVKGVEQATFYLTDMNPRTYLWYGDEFEADAIAIDIDFSNTDFEEGAERYFTVLRDRNGGFAEGQKIHVTGTDGIDSVAFDLKIGESAVSGDWKVALESVTNSDNSQTLFAVVTSLA